MPILFALSKKHYQFQQTKHHIDFGVFCISNFLFYSYSFNSIKIIYATIQFKAGTIKQTENGGTFLTLFHIPDQDFYIYPDKAKEKETPDIQLEETADTDQAYATE